MSNFREAIRLQMASFKQLERQRKKFEKGQQRIQKWLDKGNRPRDIKGRVIKHNVWDEEIVRVKNKWVLRSELPKEETY